MFGILHSPFKHIFFADTNSDNAVIIRNIGYFRSFAEIVNNVVDDIAVDAELHLYDIAAEHINVLCDVLREIQSVFLALSFLKRLYRRIKDADILNAVDTIIGDIIVFVIVADEIVTSADNRHLIRIDNILSELAVRAFAWVELFIHIIAAILKLDLLFLLDSLIKDINGIEKLSVRYTAVRDVVYMLDLALEASDAIFMNSEPDSVVKAKRIADKTMRISIENIIFALAVKAAVLILGLIGHPNMWLAVFADSGTAMLLILNSIRVLNTKKYK